MTTRTAQENLATYGIYRTALDAQRATEPALAEAIAHAVLVTTEADWDTAVALAVEFAHEHATRIDVPIAESGNGQERTGATFTTNNGTRVWYTAKPLPRPAPRK